MNFQGFFKLATCYICMRARYVLFLLASSSSHSDIAAMLSWSSSNLLLNTVLSDGPGMVNTVFSYASIAASLETIWGKKI